MARYLFIPRPGPKSEHFKKAVEEGRVHPIQHDAATSRTLARMVGIENLRARKERELRDAAEAKAERAEGMDAKLDQLVQALKESKRQRPGEQHESSAELLTKAETANRVGVSRRTIERLVHKGTFPAPINIPGTRRVAWRVQDLDAWTAKLKPKED
jgi:excisionase family DNA binding protein